MARFLDEGGPDEEELECIRAEKTALRLIMAIGGMALLGFALLVFSIALDWV